MVSSHALPLPGGQSPATAAHQSATDVSSSQAALKTLKADDVISATSKTVAKASPLQSPPLQQLPAVSQQSAQLKIPAQSQGESFVAARSVASKVDKVVQAQVKKALVKPIKAKPVRKQLKDLSNRAEQFHRVKPFKTTSSPIRRPRKVKTKAVNHKRILSPSSRKSVASQSLRQTSHAIQSLEQKSSSTGALVSGKLVHVPAWVLQLASFTREANAASLVKRLRQEGWQAYSRASDPLTGRQVVRVYIGPEINKSKLQQIARHIQQETKLKGFIRRYQTTA